MFYDPLDIVNAACARIGAEPLQDWDGDEGQAAHLSYQDVVQFNLAQTPFSFAIEPVQLSLIDGATALTGYAHVFDVPGEWLEPPIYLTDDITDPQRVYSRYRLVRRQVHAADNPLWAFRKFTPSPKDWSAPFRSATICAIAARLAMALASDRAMYDLLETEAYGTPSEMKRGGLLGVAIQRDAFATPARRTPMLNNPLSRAWTSGS